MKCLVLAATLSLGLLLGLGTTDAQAAIGVTVDTTVTAPANNPTYEWTTIGG